MQTYELVLTTRSPLFIGSGTMRTKTEYLFDSRTGIVRLLDRNAFLGALADRGLAEEYERFVLSRSTDVYGFLKDCGFSAGEISGLCLYSVSAADALDENHSLKELYTFQRDAANRAYVPGSSVKGALRTVLLCGMMEDEQKGAWPNGYNKKQNAQQMVNLEAAYLNTLGLKKDREGRSSTDAVNSILRGISISDSLPIPDKAMMLAGKYDANPFGEVKKLPLCRECVAPGTKITFRLTLDRSVLREQWNIQKLQEAIGRFDEYYQDVYLSYFQPPQKAVSVPAAGCLILGGGSGFFSKNLAYPRLGKAEGLNTVQQDMQRQFPRHGHDKDTQKYNVSPHMMKYAKYQGGLYPYGVCEVSIR